MGIDDWSATEAQNVSLGKYDVSRGEAPDASTSEHARVLMAEIKALSDSVDERLDNFVGENIEVDGVTIENNDGVLTVKDVAIDGDTEDLLTDKIAEIEAAAETASGKASDAATAAEQAAASASVAVGSVSSAVDAANAAAAQASLAAQAAGRAQSGAALAESAVQAVVSGTNLNWQKTSKDTSVSMYPVPDSILEPEVEFFLTETAPESDSKSPDNPSTISGVTSVSITHCESSGVNETEYNLPLNDVYYAGKVNFATGEITVTWVGETLTSVTKYSELLTNTVSFRYDSVMTHGLWSLTESTLACNKFICASDSNDYEHIRLMGAADAENYSMRLYINKSRLDVSSAADPSSPTTDEWLQAVNNWLSLNPVFIAYKINHPFTAATNPLQIRSFSQQDKYTPQINTVYTSEASIQVGYAKSPIRSEYELTQAIIATEGGE